MQVTLERVDAAVFRVPIASPVRTSFGTMSDRPAVFVRLVDADGAWGWGEVFANWPAAGAEHRARLLMEDIADLVLGRQVSAPDSLFHALTAETHVRALQCGEWGPFRQVIAGLDVALHDLWARRLGLPLARMLREGAPGAVPVYASGIHIAQAEALLPGLRGEGIRAFKVKIGFGAADEADRLRRLADALEPGESLFADANQAWTPAEAQAFARAAPRRLGWLEEPIRADLPAAVWADLARASPVPLAGGENIAGAEDFAAAIATGHLAVLQPDLAKWGGIGGCLPVARAALAAGRRFCPHFLGGGIGLVASAHLLAAAGGDGLLELDVNPNPLRDTFAPARLASDGTIRLAGSPGLGIENLPEEIERYRTVTLSRSW